MFFYSLILSLPKTFCMKKLSFFLTLCLFAVVGAFAQTSFEIIPTGGYTFPDQVNFYNTFGRIEGGANYGGSMQFNVNKSFGIEMMYSRMEANSGVYAYGTGSQIPNSQQQLALNYIMAGPVSSINFPGSPVQLFMGGMLGAAIFEPGNGYNSNGYSSNTKFAWGVEAGTNIYATPRFGIRLKAQLLSPVDGAGGSFYFGTGGSGAGVYTYSSIYQFGFSAGLIIGLGSILPNPQPRVAPQRRPPPPPGYYYYRPAPPPPPPGYYYHN